MRPSWLFLSAAILASAHSGAQSAETTLRQALEKQRSLYATIFQTRFDDTGGKMLIKVQFAGKDRMKITMLSPVSRAGIVSIDDTKEFRVYYPDRSVVVTQPSPTAYQPKVDWRMRNIRRNYSLTLEEPQKVAGRTVLPLVIEPKHSELPTRTMFVDSKTHLVLRYQITPHEGKPTLYFDTLEVMYGKEVADVELSLPKGYEDFEVKREPGPRPVTNYRAVKSETGFVPRVPKELPLGFHIHSVHLIGSGDRAFVAVRLSDGMCSVTVFQWLGSRFTKDPGGRGLARQIDQHGVHFSLSSTPGDRVSRSVALELLGSFAGNKP